SVDQVAADLVRFVPGAVARDEDATAVLRGEHRAGIEAHAERGRMGSQLGNWRDEFAAGMAPAELVVRNGALVAVRISEVLAHFGYAVEFVVRQFLGEP